MIYTGKERDKVKEDALRRSLGMDPRRKASNKKHGRRVKRAPTGHRVTSRESRQEAIS